MKVLKSQARKEKGKYSWEAENRRFQLIQQFKQEWNLESIYVAESALYSADNIQQLEKLNWITLVPRSIKTAKILAESIKDDVFVESEISGYRIASCCCDYGGVPQGWLVVESEKRRDSHLKQLDKQLTKQLKIATSELKSLMRQDFACAVDAKQAAEMLSRNWKYHSLELVAIETHPHYIKAGRPTKQSVSRTHYLSCHCSSCSFRVDN